MAPSFVRRGSCSGTASKQQSLVNQPQQQEETHEQRQRTGLSSVWSITHVSNPCSRRHLGMTTGIATPTMHATPAANRYGSLLAAHRIVANRPIVKRRNTLQRFAWQPKPTVRCNERGQVERAANLSVRPGKQAQSHRRQQGVATAASASAVPHQRIIH